MAATFTCGATARRAILVATALALVVASGREACALRPNSPVVQEAIAKGITYLDTHDDPRLGGKALIGLAYLKNGSPPDHPKVRAAVDAIKTATAVGPNSFGHDIYSTGISILLLVAVDPSKYRGEIEVLVRSLHYRQKEHGAWGYPVGAANDLGKTCDTSMTQYAVLGLWEAEELAGVTTPPEVWEKVGKWLLMTQDPNGGYGYQGVPSESVGKRVKQNGVKHSMAAAGMGALYLLKDRLGFMKLKKRAAEGVPAVLQPAADDAAAAPGGKKSAIERRDFHRAVEQGNSWIEDSYRLASIDKEKDWFHYSLYALERYYSLREADEGGENWDPDPNAQEGPAWYNQGARLLLDSQQADGSWKSVAGEVPDTCFAILFLLRSTRKTLEKASLARHAAGRMVGGAGIPAVADVRLREGAVVVQPLPASLAEVLLIVADPGHVSYAAAVETLADLARRGDRQELTSHAADLARLAVSGAPEVRVLAVRAVARARDLDQAPLLIHLLRDGDARVVRAASDSLGEISRKYTDFNLGAEPTTERREQAIAEWKAWFKSVRPDVDLESYDPTAALP